MEIEIVDDTANQVLDNNPLYVGHEIEPLSVNYEKDCSRVTTEVASTSPLLLSSSETCTRPQIWYGSR